MSFVFPICRRAWLVGVLAVAATGGRVFGDAVTWVSPTGGGWTDATNWSSDPALPDVASDVTIGQVPPLTVTLSAGNQSVNSLVLGDTLVLSGGVLSVATNVQVAGQLTLSGGTLANATVATVSPGNVTLTSGTLSNVTLASNVSATNPALSLANNFTLSNSTLTLTATTAATLSFAGNETFGGTGAVVLNGTRSVSLLGSAANVTIGSGVTFITGTAGANVQVGTLTNQGTLIAQVSGKTIAINSPSFTNTGTLKALNGGTITINSTAWTTPGAIVLDGTSTVNLGGTLTVADLGAISRTGGTVNITGVLDHGNNTLALGTADAVYTVLGGTITNGNVSLMGGAAITLAVSGTVSAPTLSVGTGGQFVQTGGTLTVTNLTQTGGTISLGGTQSSYNFANVALSGGTTTLTADTAKMLVTPALTFGGGTDNWTGQLELGANKLVVQATAAGKADALAALQNQVLYGQTHAAGITSSNLPANMGIAVVDNGALATPFTTFGGQSVTGNSLLVSRELLGDADLSGTVDLNDLNTVLNHLGTTTSSWTGGNFDGAATIDLADLNDVLNNLGVTFAGGASMSAGVLPATVPEASSMLIVLAVVPLLVRGRRNA